MGTVIEKKKEPIPVSKHQKVKQTQPVYTKVGRRISYTGPLAFLEFIDTVI